MKNKFLNKKILGKFINIINIFFIIISIFLTSTKGVDSMGYMTGDRNENLDLTPFQDLYSGVDTNYAYYVYKKKTTFHKYSTHYYYKGTELYYGDDRWPGINISTRLDDGWLYDSYYLKITGIPSSLTSTLRYSFWRYEVVKVITGNNFSYTWKEMFEPDPPGQKGYVVRGIKQIKTSERCPVDGKEFKVYDTPYGDHPSFCYRLVLFADTYPIMEVSGWVSGSIQYERYLYGDGYENNSRGKKYIEYYNSSFIPDPPPPPPDPKPPVTSVKAPRIEDGGYYEYNANIIYIHNDNDFPVQLYFKYHVDQGYGTSWTGPSEYNGQGPDINPGSYMEIQSGSSILGYVDYKFDSSNGESDVVTWQFPDSSY